MMNEFKLTRHYPDGSTHTWYVRAPEVLDSVEFHVINYPTFPLEVVESTRVRA